jgi:hypothetical protein
MADEQPCQGNPPPHEPPELPKKREVNKQQPARKEQPTLAEQEGEGSPGLSITGGGGHA